MATIDKISLDGEWKVRGYAGEKAGEAEFKGIVPGSVHTDLIRNGLMADPFFGLNADRAMYVEEHEYRYSREFVVPEGADPAHAELEFAGLDTFCHIYLNGRKLGMTDNMFIKHIFDVSDVLKYGKNVVEVVFIPPESMISHKNMNGLGSVFGRERLFIRKMQCSFGWDWVHRLLTDGIWRPVTVYFRGKARISSVFARTSQIDDAGAEVKVDVDVVRIDPDTAMFLTTVLKDPEGVEIWRRRRLLKEIPHLETISVEKPRLWWPAGSGDQPLYSVETTVKDAAGELIDFVATRFGIRTIRILQIEDVPGSPEWEMSLKAQKLPNGSQYDSNTSFSSFFLLVNGKKIICRGGNWVPADPFPAEVGRGKYRELVRLAAKGNMNMLRVWGGGIYEDPDFYDACDEAGILLTQDFMMACARYPDRDKHFMDLMKIESKAVVTELRNHPSIAWWSGDNENAMLGSDDNPNDAGRKIAREITGEAVRLLDGTRPFLPSSPWGGENYSSSTRGTTHFTAYLTYYSYYVRDTDMKDYVKHFGAPTARFAPETPALGMPCLSSMRKFMTDDMIFSDDVTVLKYHMKNHPGREFAAFDYFDTIKTMAEKIFGGFTDHHDRIRKMILVQYEWIRAATEAFRRRNFYSGGLLYWMFNDCWPALGWSLVDYYCVPKSGWYALKRAGANVSASLEALEDGGVAAWISNCGMSEAKCSVRVSLQPFDRQEAIREWKGEFTNRGNISKAVLKIKPDEITELANGTCVMVFDLEYETEHEHFTDRTFYSPLLFREWKMPAATVTVTRNGGETGGSLDVSTDLYAHGISLDGQYVFSDNYFNLNPGETRTIDYRAAYQSEGGPIGTAWLNMK